MHVRLTTESDELKTTGLCFVCKKVQRRYACPKCELPYCSLACYKKHGERCTETFFQENVTSFLQSAKPTEEDKTKMLGILSRVRQNQLDEEEQMEVEQELADLDLEDPDLFSKLTPAEQKDFLKFLESGQISTLITIWEPWWKKSPQAKFVQELDQNEEFLETAEFPKIKESIPPLSSLTPKPPSTALIFNLLDILYAYTYVQRLYNGECSEHVEEACSVLCSVSAVLSRNSIYGSVPHAVQQILENAMKPEAGGRMQPRTFVVTTLEDVHDILKSKEFVLMALSHLLELFKQVSMGKKIQKGNSEWRRTLTNILKKLEFFLSWANETSSVEYEQVRSQLKLEYETQKSLLDVASHHTNSAPKPTNVGITQEKPSGYPKPLIQEI